MKLINDRTVILNIAERWKQQYFYNGKWNSLYESDSEKIYLALNALDRNTATSNDIKNIIGNDSWAGPYKCHECKAVVDSLVTIGEP